MGNLDPQHPYTHRVGAIEDHFIHSESVESAKVNRL